MGTEKYLPSFYFCEQKNFAKFLQNPRLERNIIFMKDCFRVTSRNVIISPKNVVTLKLYPSLSEWFYVTQPIVLVRWNWRSKEGEDTKA